MITVRRPRPILRHLLWILPAILYWIWLVSGLRGVPFHPDEATWIYMSRDLDRVFAAGPGAVCWRPESAGDPLQVERERACPLPRDIIGVSRLLAGRSATTTDWNWSLSWEENAHNGALPSDEVIFLARLPQTLMLLLAVLLLGRIGWRVGGITGAATAALLFAFNSQILLHSRRAMSESALLFGMILVVALVFEWQAAEGRLRRMVIGPGLIGLALAITVSAKLSGVLVLPVAAAAMFLPAESRRTEKPLLSGLGRVAILTVCFLALFLVLNPLYLCHPLDAVRAVVSSRDHLFAGQLDALRQASPGQALDTPGLRLLAMVYQPFLAPLAFWDIPNYAAATTAAQQAYLADPLLNLTSGGVISGLWVTLTIVGMVLSIIRFAKPWQRGRLIILWVWTLGVLVGILWQVPILWQRYYLPLIPVFAIWAGLAVSSISGWIIQSRERGGTK